MAKFHFCFFIHSLCFEFPFKSPQRKKICRSSASTMLEKFCCTENNQRILKTLFVKLKLEENGTTDHDRSTKSDPWCRAILILLLRFFEFPEEIMVASLDERSKPGMNPSRRASQGSKTAKSFKYVQDFLEEKHYTPDSSEKHPKSES